MTIAGDLGHKATKQTNSVDPDEMAYYVAFHLGVQCLYKYLSRGQLR